ncbi:MAG TPA: hypothetical protein VFN35_00300, partial [Ktedonobacteraceae bacterium]|nr:hypothetical protein [Ktedonobacteraceae bacterium]
LLSTEHTTYEQQAVELYNQDLARKAKITEEIENNQARYDSLYEDLYGKNARTDLSQDTKTRMINDMIGIEHNIVELKAALKVAPQTKTTYPELVTLLRMLRESRDEKVINKATQMAELFICGIDITNLSPHFFRCDFEWVAWGWDSCIIWRPRAGAHEPMIPEELETLRELVMRKASKLEFMQAFPSRSPASLQGIVETQLKLGGVSRLRSRYNASGSLSLDELNIVEKYSLAPSELGLKQFTVFWLPEVPIEVVDIPSSE